MINFKNIIGYEDVKKELSRICDIITNPEKYKQLGVTIPKGVLLYGDMGVGKTEFARAFCMGVNRKTFFCSKSKPNGEFVNYISQIFEKAKNEQPSIVFLDDLDKFANNDEDHKNAEEFITVQSCIDSVAKDDVFVIATANEIDCLPPSLLRAGRFDSIMELKIPNAIDSQNIIKYYLSKKEFLDKEKIDEACYLLSGNSCAKVQGILNQAGIYAGFENRKSINFDDIVKVVVRDYYKNLSAPKIKDAKNLRLIAYHEAGHAVISEIFRPNSVVLLSLGGVATGNSGFTKIFDDDRIIQTRDDLENEVCISLGGMCGVDVKFGIQDLGGSSDVLHATSRIRDYAEDCGLLGLDKISCYRFNMAQFSEKLKSNQEDAIFNELIKCYNKTIKLIKKNQKFLEALAENLMEKRTLTRLEILSLKKQYYTA